MSSFRHHMNNNKQFNKKFISSGKNLLYQKFLQKLLSVFVEKRMSFLFSFFCKKYKASMAVEAAIAVPFFFFFFINILFAFDMLRLHGNIMGAMHQVGNKMAFQGYAYRNIAGEGGLLTEEMDSFILSEGYAGKEIINKLGKEYLENTCLVDGASGIHFWGSSVMKGNDIIELVASYRVKPFIKVMGFSDFYMENRYYGRAWTGYDVEGRESGTSKEDLVVYVAENGVVYHLSRNCSYLNPSVEAVSALGVKNLRNEFGGRYYPCDSCGSSDYQAVVYITTRGNRIHGSLSCPGLKRTIYTIHLSEAGTRGRCFKCG